MKFEEFTVGSIFWKLDNDKSVHLLKVASTKQVTTTVDGEIVGVGQEVFAYNCTGKQYHISRMEFKYCYNNIDDIIALLEIQMSASSPKEDKYW